MSLEIEQLVTIAQNGYDFTVEKVGFQPDESQIIIIDPFQDE
jgi:hypothetical protein